MRRMICVGAIVVTCGLMQGCLAVAGLVAAGSYAASNDDKDKQAFQQLNLEREKAGLRPLTWEEWKKGKNAGATEQASK